jgi:hypothetical protein
VTGSQHFMCLLEFKWQRKKELRLSHMNLANNLGGVLMLLAIKSLLFQVKVF